MPSGSVTPAPAGVGVVAAGVGAAVTWTLADADVEAAACGEVAVAVRVMLVPTAFCGTATDARTWTGWAVVRPTEHVTPPGGAQTVKPGAGFAGFTLILTFAVPFSWFASQTQMA
jgi:hypothetical protein